MMCLKNPSKASFLNIGHCQGEHLISHLAHCKGAVQLKYIKPSSLGLWILASTLLEPDYKYS